MANGNATATAIDNVGKKKKKKKKGMVDTVKDWFTPENTGKSQAQLNREKAAKIAKQIEEAERRRKEALMRQRRNG